MLAPMRDHRRREMNVSPELEKLADRASGALWVLHQRVCPE